MHIQTHLVSGWCFGNYIKLTPKERFFCILASGIPDLDGLGYFINEEWYYDFHHVLGHNLFFGFLMSAFLSFFSSNRKRAFLCYLILFHIHLIMDFLGSGPGWTISYLWPLTDWKFENPLAWEFFSWQNLSTGFFFYGWTLWIIIVKKRTPLEYPMPSLDKQIVDLAENISKKIKGSR